MNNIEKTKNLKTNIYIGFISKISSVLISLYSVKVYLDNLGTTDYGVWITLFSFLSWIYIADFGIGNGLRINLTKLLSNNEITKAKDYICTSYIITLIITGMLFFLAYGCFHFFSISSFLNIKAVSSSEVNNIFLLLLTSVLISFITNLYKQLLYATHKSSLVDVTYVIQQGLIIISIIIVCKVKTLTLFHVAIINSIIPLLLGMIISFLFFLKNKKLVPSLKNFNVNYIHDIINVGGKFFIIQLSSIVIYSTDNVIISKYIGSSSVSSYDVTGRIFQAVIMFWYVISSPLTSLYSNAYYKNDFQWIFSIIKKLNLVYFILCLLVFVLISISPEILKLWIGDSFVISRSLILFFGVFVLIRIYGDLYMPFLNAIGMLNYQLYFILIGSFLNIPLSIFFIKYFNLGASGVILATCISILPLAIVSPLQTFFVLRKKIIIKESK
ncbi:TPA: lipopolysaccharide biosynthesis protein [Photobacterium damselae]